MRNTIGGRITHPQLIIIDNTWGPGWPAMNFCRTFRNTALKEIQKIYTVQGRKFFLSFPAPYTYIFFSVQLSRGFSRLPQRESLLAGYIHTSGQTQFLQVKWERWQFSGIFDNMAFIHETANVSFKGGSKAICN